MPWPDKKSIFSNQRSGAPFLPWERFRTVCFEEVGRLFASICWLPTVPRGGNRMAASRKTPCSARTILKSWKILLVVCKLLRRCAAPSQSVILSGDNFEYAWMLKKMADKSLRDSGGPCIGDLFSRRCVLVGTGAVLLDSCGFLSA